ncbi:Ig-like domain-containing protein [Gemmatimonas sp.]
MTQPHVRNRHAETWRSVARLVVGALLLAAPIASCGESTAVTVDVARIEVSPATTTVQAGGSVTLTARALDVDGNAIGAPVLRWSSNDNSIATVAATGVVSTISAGTARIAVSSMGKSAVATITVAPRAVASLTIAPAQTTLLVARSTRLTAQPLDANGAPLTGRTIAWSSSDVTVAQVENDGTVTGIAPGAATIVATTEGRTAQAAVTVALPPVQAVTVSPTRDTLAVNGARQFAAELRDAAGAVLTGRSVVWASDNTTVAITSASGVVTALSPGTATISASSEGRSGAAVLVVLARLASAVTVTPGVASITVGNSLPLTVQITDAQGNVLTGRPLTFVSESPLVATVSASGVVTAVAAGTARIVVSSEGKTGTATIQVTPVPVASLAIAPTSVMLTTGDVTTLVATARSAAGGVLTGRTIDWRSGAPNVATVSASGIVTAVAPGAAVILATVEGVSATSTITVRVPPIATITLSPSSPTIDPGQSVQLTAVARASNGETLAGRPMAWTTSNEQVAFVSSTGLVVGVRPGTAVIAATAEGISATIIVTVR